MNKNWELIAPCHFGLEAVLKREITDLGYEISRVEDGKVTFFGDARAIADANMLLRTTERVLLKVGEVRAATFEELFEGGTEAQKALLRELDVLVDGRFVLEKRSLDCRFRGSTNQRLIDVPKSLKAGAAVELPD